MEHIHKKDKSLQMCFLLTYLALQLHCITLTTTPHFISLFFSKLALGEQIILCMAPAQPVGVAQSQCLIPKMLRGTLPLILL